MIRRRWRQFENFWKRQIWRRQAWKPFVLLVVLIILIGGFTHTQNDRFLSDFNLNSLLLATLPLALVAMAQVNALLVGDLDISVGATMTAGVIIASYIITPESSWIIALVGGLAMLAAGIGIGISNAGLVHGIKIPSIIATLATLSIIEGVALSLRPVAKGLINFDVADFVTYSIGFVPVAFIAVIIVALVWDIWLHASRPGLILRAVGYDKKAARRLGASEKWIRIRALIISGFMASVASIFLAAQIQVGDATAGSQFALLSIAAAVLGGTSLGGGRGSFMGAVVAALFLRLITTVQTFLIGNDFLGAIADAIPILSFLTDSNSFGPISIGLLTIIGLILYQAEDMKDLIKHTYKQFRRRLTARRVRERDYVLPTVHITDVTTLPEAGHHKLLKGGTVLTMDSQIGNFVKGDVLIDGTKIAAVAPNIEPNGAQVIDATDMIVMPGFVDTHRHIWEGLLRNIGTDIPLEGRKSYMNFVLDRLAPAYRPQDAYVGNLVSALGAIDAGITTLLDWSHIQGSPDHTDAVVEALQNSGMRAVFGYGFPWWGKWETNQPGWFVRAAREHFSSQDQLLTLALAPYGPEFTEFEVSKAHWKLARDVNARITVHVGVGTFGKDRKLQEFGEAGLLGDDTTYIHCTTLNDTEIQMIVDTGGTVSLAAPVEMMMGHGMPPTQKFLDRGLRPSLSVDVETNVPGDMFTQMRSILSLQRALLHNRALNGEENLPSFLTARDALEFATIEGARANGLADKVGTLTPGKEADVIMLDTNRINVMPVNDPIGAVVWGMDTSNVDSVFIAGKPMKRNGELIGVDLNAVNQMVTDARNYVIKKSRFSLPKI